ncbi:MAG TPA: hypothetical protein VI217_01230, partial [Mycobacterium sp.]
MSAVAERRVFANMGNVHAHSREALQSLFTHQAAASQQRNLLRPGESCLDGRTVVYCRAWIG